MRAVAVFAAAAVLLVVAALVGPVSASLRGLNHHGRGKQPWVSDVMLGPGADVLQLLCGKTPMPLCAQALTSPRATGAVHAARKQIAKRALRFVANGVRHASHLKNVLPPQSLPPHVQEFFSHVREKVPRDASDMDIAVAFSAARKRGELRHISGDPASTDQYPYFGFLPRTLGLAAPAAEPFTAPTECFSNVSMSTAWSADRTHLVATLTTAGQTSFLCTDTYAIGLLGVGFKLVTVYEEGTTTHSFKVDLSNTDAATQWYISSRGLVLFKFNKSVLGLIGDIVDTVILLAGFFTSPLPNATVQANFDFLQDYVEYSPRMQPASMPRTAGATVVNALNESYIQSGDALVVVRYDGLDPVIGWGEGFTGGHSTIALREPSTGKLHVCESTSHDGYWATNGIQCTPWRMWFDLAQKASYNVLLAPITPANAAKFNATAAWNFFTETEGLNYGYLNFVFSWIDVRKNNFPCLPPTFEYCLNEQVVEIIAILVDSVQPNSPENIFRQALNHRVGTFNYSVTQVMQYAATVKNLTFPEVYTMVEQDSWMYNTTRYGNAAVGRVMTCCVFVCHMWKHGGLFDSIDREINCGEQTLWDVFSMNMFDPAKIGANRPEVCKANDPNNELCQLIGEYTFHAKPDFNTRSLYKHMGEKCSSQCPNYERPAGC